MNRRARNFVAANENSPVVYGSVDGALVTYRLANGKIFRLSAADARQTKPRWAFIEREWAEPALAEHEASERETLAKVQAEAMQ